jgi:hypothetical protein
LQASAVVQAGRWYLPVPFVQQIGAADGQSGSPWQITRMQAVTATHLMVDGPGFGL